jgi:transcriptional regulator with XRE-family HTH domain
MSLSRESFAELCDISESFLSDIERGNKSMTTKTLYKICSAGNVSPDYIVLGSSKRNSDIDTVIDMISNIDNRHIPFITNILKEYIQAINIDK